MASLDSLSVAELEKLLGEKLQRVKQLTATRDQLYRELASVEKELATLGGGAKRRGRPPKTAKGSVSRAKSAKTGPRPKNSMTMKQAVSQALKGSKGGLTLSEIAAGVKKLGYKSNSDNFENVVYQCLYNNPKMFPKGKDKKYTVKS